MSSRECHGDGVRPASFLKCILNISVNSLQTENRLKTCSSSWHLSVGRAPRGCCKCHNWSRFEATLCFDSDIRHIWQQRQKETTCELWRRHFYEVPLSPEPHSNALRINYFRLHRWQPRYWQSSHFGSLVDMANYVLVPPDKSETKGEDGELSYSLIHQPSTIEKRSVWSGDVYMGFRAAAWTANCHG